MSLQFSMPLLSILPMQQGAPAGYSGAILANSTSSYYQGDAGQIIIQEVSTPLYSVRLNVLNFFEKIKLYFTREESGLHTSAILENQCRTTIVGAGRFKIKQGYFSSLYADAWRGSLEWEGRNRLSIFETNCHKNFLENFLPDDHKWNSLFERYNEVPLILGYPFRKITPLQNELIRNLMYSTYDDSIRELAIDHLLKAYLVEVLQEVDNPDWLKGSIDKHDLTKIEMAKALIASNSLHHHHTAEIARQVNMNECKLKALFVRVTGMGTFDYMMYLRCIAVRDKILSTDLPVKAFYKEAGYHDLANFVTGFKKYMGCTPAEIRKKI